MSPEKLVLEPGNNDLEIFSTGPQYEGVFKATNDKTVVSFRVALGPNNPGYHIAPVAQMYKEFFERRGYQVVITSNGKELW